MGSQRSEDRWEKVKRFGLGLVVRHLSGPYNSFAKHGGVAKKFNRNFKIQTLAPPPSRPPPYHDVCPSYGYSAPLEYLRHFLGGGVKMSTLGSGQDAIVETQGRPRIFTGYLRTLESMSRSYKRHRLQRLAKWMSFDPHAFPLLRSAIRVFSRGLATYCILPTFDEETFRLFDTLRLPRVFRERLSTVLGSADGCRSSPFALSPAPTALPRNLSSSPAPNLRFSFRHAG